MARSACAKSSCGDRMSGWARAIPMLTCTVGSRLPMREGFLQLGHLRQRPFETAVLEQHARMTGERLEDPEIVVRERRHVSGAVADQDQAECLRLRAQNADDAVLEPARGEQRVQRVRR